MQLCLSDVAAELREICELIDASFAEGADKHLALENVHDRLTDLTARLEGTEPR